MIFSTVAGYHAFPAHLTSTWSPTLKSDASSGDEAADVLVADVLGVADAALATAAVVFAGLGCLLFFFLPMVCGVGGFVAAEAAAVATTAEEEEEEEEEEADDEDDDEDDDAEASSSR